MDARDIVKEGLDVQPGTTSAQVLEPAECEARELSEKEMETVTGGGSYVRGATCPFCGSHDIYINDDGKTCALYRCFDCKDEFDW